MTSFWFLALEIEDRAGNDATKQQAIDIMNQSSLQRYLELDYDQYISMLITCNLMKRVGKKIHVLADKWKAFFIYHNIEAEIDPTRPLDTPRAHYIRIGKKVDGYHTSVKIQARRCVFGPPRCNGIHIIRRAMKAGLDRLMGDELDALDAKAAAATATDNKSSNSEDSSIRANNERNKNSVDKTPSDFPMLQKFKIDKEQFSTTRGKHQLKRLLGELMAVQQEQSGNKCTVEYCKMAREQTEKAVLVESHKSPDAFERYHRDKPYIDEFINGMDDEEDVAITRLLLYLAKKHENYFIQVAQEAGLAFIGIMNEIECGAMISEAGLLDLQFRTVMKHLGYKFKAKVAVPFQRVKDTFCQGYTKPKVKVYEHRREGKEAEIVVAEYQSVKEEFKGAVLKLIAEHNITSRKDIKEIKLVVGGDHGQGAFRLCILVIIELHDRDPVDVAVSIGKVFCSKEEGVLLDETIMDWVSTDLEMINDSIVLLGISEDGKCTIDYRHYNEPELDYDAEDLFPVVTTQYSAGDCAWQSYLNGKLNMSPHWCLYCPLSRSQFSDPNHPVVNWTIETLTEMANDASKKGADRLGVTGRPYFPWIPMINRILPILHLLLGIGNDIITYFGHVVEWNLILLPEEEKEWQKEVLSLNEKIPDLQAACANWDNTEWNGTTKSKRRSNLMTARRKGQLAQAESDELTLLDDEFKEVRKSRDDAQAKKRELLKKINAGAKARRTPPKDVQTTWYLEMEKIYRTNGVVREDYYKKMFAGGPLKKIMDNAEAIFDEAKVMLRRYKDENVEEIDAKIDAHCDKVVDLLQTWNNFFRILHKESPTEEDFVKLEEVAAEAEEKHRIVRTVVDNSNDVPKPHIAGRHAVEQFREHKGLLRKMYEQFVEHNHQIELKNENKYKRIPNHEKRAESSAKRRHGDSNSDFARQRRKVNKSTARGKYDKGNNE